MLETVWNWILQTPGWTFVLVIIGLLMVVFFKPRRDEGRIRDADGYHNGHTHQ